ncbi:hypothetical protein SLA2020_415590 [Shorea laevis]
MALKIPITGSTGTGCLVLGFQGSRRMLFFSGLFVSTATRVLRNPASQLSDSSNVVDSNGVDYTWQYSTVE